MSLTYNIGVDGSSKIHFRITDNKTGCLLFTEWIALDAVPLAEGALQRYKETKRMVIIGEPDKFQAELMSLVDSDTSLHDVIAERLAARKLREV